MADKLANISEGAKLHAIYAADGEYYPAVVVSVSTSKNRSKKPVKVKYTDYEEEVWVGLDDLKSKKLGLKVKETPTAKSKAKAKGKKEEAKPDYSGFSKGAKLQVKADDGSWYPAQVVVVSKKNVDSPLKINWVGYTSASDEWVGADRIRSKALKFISARVAKPTGPLKNAAFVFIKPHAVTDKVKEMVKAGLIAKGLKILKEGSIKGEVIDKKKLIDQHYYAIASKATILKPDQLNVPEDKFQAQFGLSWKDALASGKVFNAMDGCKELGIDSDGLDKEWAKCKDAKKLVKFGGGFYCGLIEMEGKTPLYIFNGFFMSMRSKFTEPGTQIYYYSVEWDPTELSWADFRGKLLGPTDPAEAPVDSLRGEILAKWEDLGLKTKPNVGDNGVHASASPFEAFAERNNWLGVPIEKDSFGTAMLGSRVPPKVIKGWSVDPQVKIEGDKMGSIFDQLEDMDVKECLAKFVDLSNLNKPPLKNSAFVFIKPHAVTDAVKSLVKAGLEAKGLRVLKEGSIKGEVIDKKKLIDQHYYAIASKATILKPDQLNVPEDKFQAQFGLSWKDALASGKVFNAMDACNELGIDSDGLDKEWAKCKDAKKLVKFGGGFYCGLVEVEGKTPLYVFNGFFMSMRSKFTQPGTEIYYYLVEWEQKDLSWADFRGKVLGPTDPADAPKDSLRGEVLAKWEDLGLKSKPNVGDNGVHASASPFEAFAERNNWLSVPMGRDPFSRAMLGARVPRGVMKAWSVDPQIKIEGDKMGSIFDSVEDMDATPCLDKIVDLAKLNKPPAKNCAFVFIKPHAVTDKVQAAVKAGLEAKGVKILKEGSIKGEVIDKKKLIDQHYYAIASKATILKPDQLNVPEDKFQAQFGLSWKDALASGNVFNAMDGCKELGIDEDGLDKEWAKCKDAKKLVKFGGGFYCGLIEMEGKTPLYIFNGFFMSMRAKFTQPGTQIYYYSVEWDPKVLSWSDFRGKLLGPTDPAEAPVDSLRGEILAKWEEFGLKGKPNVGDNGVHASASPFEAFAERNNWLKIPIGKDKFGRMLLSEDMSVDTIKAWSVDPQVNIGDGKKGSIFDQLEDMDVDDCLSKVVALSKQQ